MFLKLKYLFFIFALCFIKTAEANDLMSLDLGEIIVTPHKTWRDIGILSRSISIVTEQGIEATIANSVGDVLAFVPGVFVHKTGDFGRADVVIRGMGERGKRVMIMVDGKPSKMGLYGCTITHALNFGSAERIEIIKGSSSVLHGSSALGGVVNIVTKKPEEKSEGEVNFSYGSFDTLVYNLKQGGNLDTFGYYFVFDKRKSRGHLPNSDYTQDSFTLDLDKMINEDISISFSSLYFDGFKREPEPSSFDTWNNYKRGFFDLTLEGKYFGAKEIIKVYRKGLSENEVLQNYNTIKGRFNL